MGTFLCFYFAHCYIFMIKIACYGIFLNLNAFYCLVHCKLLNISLECFLSPLCLSVNYQVHDDDYIIIICIILNSNKSKILSNFRFNVSFHNSTHTN